MEITKETIVESIKQIESIIHKINAINIDNLRKSQQTLIERRLTALNISLNLLTQELVSMNQSVPGDIISILGEKNLEETKNFIPYQSLVFCVIDAIFSIRAKYNPTVLNVLNRTARALKMESRYDVYSISDFLNKYQKYSIEDLSDALFHNRQRTSATNGVLKAQVVYEALTMFKEFGFDSIEDFNHLKDKSILQSKWLALHGQKSGVTWRYLLMLTGNQNEFKDDTHIYRFFINELGYSLKIGNDYDKLKEAFDKEHKIIQSKYPEITIQMLDYIIWKYMSEGSEKRK